MSDRVCQGDSEAYKLFGTPDDFRFESMIEDLKLQIWAHEEVEGVDEAYRDYSLGLSAWRVIEFALERGWKIPQEVFPYLLESAKQIDQWALQNGHPSELKKVLHLHGKRKLEEERTDPRWIYRAICQLRERDQKATITCLVRECIKQFPQVGADEEYVRQKYYQGRKLAKTGSDYKGRGRVKEICTSPATSQLDDELDF